jgi:hypothetical protein
MEADGGAFVRYDPWATIDSEAFTPWGPLSDSWIRTGGRTIRLAASNSTRFQSKHLRSSLGPETRFAAKMFPLESFIATPVLLPANLRRRGIIGSESHILPRSSREPDRARERPGCRRSGVSAMSASRLDTLQVSSIAILAPGYRQARFGSRFPPEAATIKSDPKTDRQLLGAHPEIWNRNDRRCGRNHLSPSML